MGRRKHRCWQPDALDPPAQLADVAIVLLSTKMPSSIGSVARAASSFECEDLRLVAPRCDPLARSARNSSKGAQYLLWRAREFGSLPEATADAAVTVAFTRWIKGEASRGAAGPGVQVVVCRAPCRAAPAASLCSQLCEHTPKKWSKNPWPPGCAASAGRPQAFRSPGEMYAAAELAQLFHCERRAAGASSTAAAGGGKVVLVFGREEAGLTEEEIAFCDYTCSIPIGRLQESLSLSHAVSVVLSQLFQLRLDYSTLPGTLEELAPGYPLDAAGSEDE